MPVVIRRVDAARRDPNIEIAVEDWYLPQQISALEAWLAANATDLDPQHAWVADIGFVARPDASGGGPVLTREFMERCVRANLELWFSEYREGDSGRYGMIVDALVGQDCSATLATNSIKLAFGEREQGRPYIWIDPPWRLETDERVTTSSEDYADERFEEWARLLAPLRPSTLTAWSDGEGETTFTFVGGVRLAVPWRGSESDDASWYSHWYADFGRPRALPSKA